MDTLVSIITVARNSAATIKDSCDSVAKQTWPSIEHILIDGASCDDTVVIARQSARPDLRILSEPDCGIYYAMNKGLQIASGEIVGFLNSDDFYADQNVIADIVNAINDTGADCCYGDLMYVAKKDPTVTVRYWKSKTYNEGLFEKGWHPPHPTFFVRRRYLMQYGMFDPELSISADYELMLRFLRKFHAKSIYIPRVMVNMRTGGTSGGNLWRIAKANWECYIAWKKNSLPISPMIMLKKPLSKIEQLVLRK